MQHLSSNYRAGGVVNEAEQETIFHCARDGSGLESEQGDGGSQALLVGDRYRGLLLRSTAAVATRLE